jgi:succinate dehydrogenase/fumarate reductase iron-sulfur protein
MSSTRWKVVFQIFRQKAEQKSHFDSFTIEVDPDEYVLDGIERIWAFHDRSLMFRHACHHSACGACAMRVNGAEKLTCITTIRSVTRDGGAIRVEPLRNFPVVSDLVVDMGAFYQRMEEAGARQVLPVADAPLSEGIKPSHFQDEAILRLGDCIECGMCVSACPVALTTPDYLGPAVLAALQAQDMDRAPSALALTDSQGGAWRCHSAYECSAVCPSFVEPGWRIMDLRMKVVGQRIKQVFNRKKERSQE